MRSGVDCWISTSAGTFRGTQSGSVQVYRGIRYALPPTDDRRFCLPEPVPRSAGVIDARRFSPVAPQPGFLSRRSGGDCLSLNIWRNVAADGSAPVLFYVHGGAGMRGTGSAPVFDGARLARDWNVVVVTINYRLGAFGFLDFSGLDGRCVANPGLHDVVLALQWTHDHIGAFGGDPGAITAVGESAGGTLVSLLPVLDDAAPLLSRVVLMSGVPTALLPPREAAEVVERFLRFLGVRTVEDLRRLPDARIVGQTGAFMRRSGLGAGSFVPAIDGIYLRDFPVNLLRRGAYRPLPMLIGTTRDEMSLVRYPYFRRRWALDHVIAYGLSRESAALREEITRLCREHYGERGWRVQLLSDMVIRAASLFYGEAAAARSPVWLYRQDLRTAAMRAIGLGATHTSDLPLLFGNLRAGVGQVMCALPGDLRAARAVSR